MSTANATAPSPAPQLSWNGIGPIKLAADHTYAAAAAPPEDICNKGGACTECEVHDEYLCACSRCEIHHRSRQWSFDRDSRLVLAAELQPLIKKITDEDARLYHEHGEFCTCAACEVEQRSLGKPFSHEYRRAHVQAHQESVKEPRYVLTINPETHAPEFQEATAANRKDARDSWVRRKERDEQVARELATLPTSVREVVLGFEDRGGHYDVGSKDKFGLMRALARIHRRRAVGSAS